MPDSQIEEERMTCLCRSMPAPCARETRTPTDESTPMPKTNATLMRQFAKAAAASELVPTCPTIRVSTRPINIWPTCPATIGQASASVLVSSILNLGRSGIERPPNQDFGHGQGETGRRIGVCQLPAFVEILWRKPCCKAIFALPCRPAD